MERSLLHCWGTDASLYRTRFVVGALIVGLCLVALFSTMDLSNKLRYSVTPQASSGSSSLKSSTPLILPLGTKQVALNIGTNVDPILPRRADGPCARTIAFEPVVPERIPKHEQILVVPAAVSDESSLSTMYVYNQNAVSSSLSRASKKDWWNKEPGTPRIVPVVTMRDVIGSIPSKVEVTILDTDMQGYDFRAVSSAIDEIRQRPIRYLRTEVHLNNHTSYADSQNDLCNNWLPLMISAGYHLVGMEVAGRRNVEPEWSSTARAVAACQSNHHSRYQEMDALWALTNDGDLDAFGYKRLVAAMPETFPAEEYRVCNEPP